MQAEKLLQAARSGDLEGTQESLDNGTPVDFTKKVRS